MSSMGPGAMGGKGCAGGGCSSSGGCDGFDGGGWGDAGNGWGGQSLPVAPMANKRPRTMPAVSSGDPQKDVLVEKIKAFQRSGETQKQAWAAFCLEQPGNFRDPARHDISTLQMFMNGYGIV